MTTAPEPDQHPATPVVHLSRRAALEAERAAARKPARRDRPAKADRPARADRPAKAVVGRAAKPVAGRTAAVARATTEHGVRNTPDARVQRVVRRPGPRATSALVSSTAIAPRASRPQRATRITLTSALAALAMFAASAMPAHASAGTSMATSTLAPTVRTQDYAVTQAISASGLDRDEFTVGGGTAGAPGTAVSYGGDVRSPFPGPVRMSSGFGYRSAPCGACSSLHQGLDFNPGMGAPIGAVAAGTVRVSGTYFSYGTAVIIDHVIDGREVSTLYGHMIPGSSPLKVGDTVEAGEFIGKVGSSGVSTGAHLHLEVLMDGVTPIDPEAWLVARIGRSLTA
ncbi:Murein DD-endopeptidase MepM and murein hydrolase activator NlpD, contain LysM domain [Curtobacterium sp. UNCCL20]|uniref:M23 family metallopeptidase n=1 Tax=Curtobacterium sp. UNCCL20 TaxID=1502773 RepID=UPI000885D14C|nr:M23 family metallopeptidase [Curtobacterium sp. UNCCL20]SDQ11999.1 Murein DD-endopeptidase MepM and murein hydrolase activator NlpD, contain LysM domain [Curtobacterium sp. UNCCL20]